MCFRRAHWQSTRQWALTENLPPQSLVRLCAVVGAMLEAVEKATSTSPGPAPRDLNDAFLGAAYGHARTAACARSVNSHVAAKQEDDALILTRSLLLIVAQALYLVEPDDQAERERRLASARRSWAREAVRTLDHLAATGFEPTDDRERIADMEEEAKAKGVPPLPSETANFYANIGLRAYYARVYRLASDVVHYSIGSALHGFAELPGP